MSSLCLCPSRHNWLDYSRYDLLFANDGLDHIGIERPIENEMLHENRVVLTNSMQTVLCLSEIARNPIQFREDDRIAVNVKPVPPT
jgi:hypothetical protein